VTILIHIPIFFAPSPDMGNFNVLSPIFYFVPKHVKLWRMRISAQKHFIFCLPSMISWLFKLCGCRGILTYSQWSGSQRLEGNWWFLDSQTISHHMSVYVLILNDFLSVSCFCLDSSSPFSWVKKKKKEILQDNSFWQVSCRDSLSKVIHILFHC